MILGRDPGMQHSNIWDSQGGLIQNRGALGLASPSEGINAFRVRLHLLLSKYLLTANPGLAPSTVALHPRPTTTTGLARAWVD